VSIKRITNIGTVDNLRSRLSRYYTGTVDLDDTEKNFNWGTIKPYKKKKII